MKFSGLGLYDIGRGGVRRATPPGRLGAWTDGDGRTTGGRDAVSCFSLPLGVWVAKGRSLQIRKRVRRSQRVCQATPILTGGRHSSYRPALVFPRPRRRSACPPKIWHPAILWCVPPSFGGERAGLRPLPWLVPWRVSGSGLVRRGRARRSVAPWRCWNRAEWAWATILSPGQVGGLPLAMVMAMAMTMAYEAVCVFSRDDRSWRTLLLGEERKEICPRPLSSPSSLRSGAFPPEGPCMDSSKAISSPNIGERANLFHRQQFCCLILPPDNATICNCTLPPRHTCNQRRQWCSAAVNSTSRPTARCCRLCKSGKSTSTVVLIQVGCAMQDRLAAVSTLESPVSRYRRSRTPIANHAS